MSTRYRRIVLDELSVALDPRDQIQSVQWHYEEEWVQEEPTEEWTDWRYVGTIEDRDPTYFASDIQPYRLGGIAMRQTPHRIATTTWERKLIRRWVDREQGPMAKTVDTETRQSRS